MGLLSDQAGLMQFNWFLLCCILLIGVSEAASATRRIMGRPFWIHPTCLAYIFAVLFIAIAPSFANGGIQLFHTTPTVPRVRRDVSSIFRELGPGYVRRAYRMEQQDFWKLHRLLYLKIGYNVLPKSGSTKKHKNGGPNGLIPSTIRLSVAIRYFAGGSPYDIALVHGISHSEVFVSVWRVVDAINIHPSLAITFPEDYATQRSISLRFMEVSKATFSFCVGALDGLLIWIERPCSLECEISKCGPKKFYCGRKKKFGLNLQGVCDANGIFLDVSICHPGSTSDFLAFATSPLKYRIEQPGFLAPGLCLFGDNAYVNTHFMATPYKGISGGTKDDYNFYHSQVSQIHCLYRPIMILILPNTSVYSGSNQS